MSGKRQIVHTFIENQIPKQALICVKGLVSLGRIVLHPHNTCTGINIAYILFTKEILDTLVKPICRHVFYEQGLPITIRPGPTEGNL